MNTRWLLQCSSCCLPFFWAAYRSSHLKTFNFSTPFSPETPKYSRNHVEISSLLSTCGREGNLRLGSSLHASIIKNPEVYNLENDRIVRNSLVIWNSLLSMYSQCGQLSDAVRMFDEMPVRDTISCNSIISGFLRNGKFEMGFGYFKEMIRSEFRRFDRASLTTVLSACDGLEFLGVTRMLHGLVVLSGFGREVTVGNALMTSYFRCGCSNLGKRVFDEMVERNVISWTAVISGLVQNEFYEESLDLFVEMYHGSVAPNYLTYLSALSACAGLQALKEGCQIHGVVWKLGIQSDFCVESVLMDMYSKCGCVEDAWQIFESAKVVDEVSTTVVLVGFAQNGFKDEAIQIFVKMVRAGIKLDPNVISAVLGVFGVETSLDLGKQVHSLVIKKGFGANPFVSNGLINMYSKCGNLEESVKIFNEMPQRNPVSWNSMIAAFARHGNCFRAFELYEEMTSEGREPTDVTFLSLLHACSHVGLVHRGMGILETMQRVYGMVPRMEHYACVVDMLGRAGLLKEAKHFIKGLPIEPGALIWQALLGACGIHGDNEMGKYAADQLLLAAPDSPVPYTLMANMCSSEGKWNDRATIIREMKERGVPKETGTSWIEIEKKIHSFVVADQMHPQNEFIYQSLLGLLKHMTDEGHLLENRLILYSRRPKQNGILDAKHFEFIE
ncbi:unnamed protein product [Coffea canephora]|uniref:DYW domain-containing protein n=1 Tax=Coffea canephora TaxID=49390 RepID=A0A068V4K9_COFCA|nr:unnamed protein product [Coffea canephora]